MASRASPPVSAHTSSSLSLQGGPGRGKVASEVPRVVAVGPPVSYHSGFG